MDFVWLNVQTRGRHVTSYLLNIVTYLNVRRAHSVDTATRYGSNSLEIEVRWGPYFPQPSRPDLGLITRALVLRNTVYSVLRMSVLILNNKRRGLRALSVYLKTQLY
jgi:hypothetical protein